MNANYNNRKEFENAILYYIATNNTDCDLQPNGDIVDTSSLEFDDDCQYTYSDCDIIANINTDINICIGQREFIYDPNYLSNYEYAELFVNKYVDTIDAYIHEAKTGTCYVDFTFDDNEYKVRFADHNDCYANSTYNVATSQDNTDGIKFDSLFTIINNLLGV